MPTNGARVRIGNSTIALSRRAKNWPALRDSINAHVRLPADIVAWRLRERGEAEPQTPLRAPENGAPILARQGTWWLAVPGLLITLFWAWELFQDARRGKAPAPSDWLAGAAVGAFYFGWPLASSWRCYVRCDEDGLTVGELLRVRCVRYGAIEDLFLVRHVRRETVSWRPTIVVGGQTIALGELGRERELILRRIEERALNARARRFEPRVAAPLGSDLALPATLDYRDGRAALERRNVRSALIWGALAAMVGLAIWGYGWQNLGQGRGFVLFAGLIAGALRMDWLRSVVRDRRAVRAWGDGRVFVDENGLTLERHGAVTRAKWAQIARLERDLDEHRWGTIFRVYLHNGAALEIEGELPHSENLVRLLRERSGVAWQNSQRVSRLLSGITRDASGLTVREDNRESRGWALLYLGLWAFLPVLVACWACFDSPARRSMDAQIIQLFCAPPIDIPLLLSLSVWITMRRSFTVCNEHGLTHHGWFAPRSMAWEDIEAAGVGGGGMWDYVRARDGQTICLLGIFASATTETRQTLRTEIRRRAPQAEIGWKVS